MKYEKSLKLKHISGNLICQSQDLRNVVRSWNKKFGWKIEKPGAAGQEGDLNEAGSPVHVNYFVDCLPLKMFWRIKNVFKQ